MKGIGVHGSSKTVTVPSWCYWHWTKSRADFWIICGYGFKLCHGCHVVCKTFPWCQRLYSWTTIEAFDPQAVNLSDLFVGMWKGFKWCYSIFDGMDNLRFSPWFLFGMPPGMIRHSTCTHWVIFLFWFMLNYKRWTKNAHNSAQTSRLISLNAQFYAPRKPISSCTVLPL